MELDQTVVMKHILIATGIFSPDIGGPASYARTLGTHISDDTKVTVVTYSPVRRHAEDEELPFRVVRVWRALPLGMRQLVYLMKLFIVAKDADVILSLNAVSAGLPASIIARVRRKRLVVKVVGDAAWERAADKGATYLMLDDYQQVGRRGYSALLHRTQTRVCSRADRIIVPSKYLSGIVSGWGISKDNISVIYNGSDFQPAELEKEDARKEIGIAGNIILSSGRIAPWKGFRMLIKLMPQMFQVNQFFHLVIVGSGPHSEELRSMVRTLGLERKVSLVGPKSKEELAVYLAAADVFVLNSGYEGFSHQLLEALRAGVPVVTTTSGGNRELIEQGENGFLVKFNDEFNLVEAIKTLHRDKGIRKQFIESGKETVEEFSVGRMLSETSKVLLV